MKHVHLGRIGRTVAGFAGLTLAGVLAAQTVPDAAQTGPAAGPTVGNGLNLPRDGRLYGNLDPNIRKPTAIVNDSVLTGTEVDQRIALITALNNIRLSPEERDQLRMQIVRALIDETLQIQEAKANEITVTPAEVEQGFARVARNLNRTPEQLRTYLREVGSSDRSLNRQVEGELAWNRLLRKRVEPFINVGDEEVAAIIERLNASRGTEEFHLKEIYLSATPDRAQEVSNAARQMIQQIQQGAPFEYFARNFSEASTRAVSGDLDWVRAGMLPDALANAAQRMEIGHIAGPIEVPGGFSILYMADKRQVLTADPRDARLSLRQLTLRFPQGTSETQAAARAAEFAKATQAIQGCGDVNKTAAALRAEVVDSDSNRVRDLPPQLQEIVTKMQIGQATPPFGNPEEGVRVLVLCGRDDPRVAGIPSSEQIQSGLEQERVNLRAQRMLRDLRRDAVVEYK